MIAKDEVFAKLLVWQDNIRSCSSWYGKIMLSLLVYIFLSKGWQRQLPARQYSPQHISAFLLRIRLEPSNFYRICIIQKERIRICIIQKERIRIRIIQNERIRIRIIQKERIRISIKTWFYFATLFQISGFGLTSRTEGGGPLPVCLPPQVSLAFYIY